MATGADTREETNNLKSSITEILDKGGFKIKGFVSLDGTTHFHVKRHSDG